VLIETYDPTRCGDGVHDPNTVRFKQRIERRAERAAAAGLDLDELPSARTTSIMKRPTGTQPVIRLGPDRLERACSGPSRLTPMLDTPHG
jgi:hypothetical protein